MQCSRNRCKLENIGSRIDMQTHAGNSRRQHSSLLVCVIWVTVTSNEVTMTVFLTA